MSRRFLSLLLITALPLIAVSAAAHELFLAPDGDLLVLYRGHLEAGEDHAHGAGHAHGPEACPAGLLDRVVGIDGSGLRWLQSSPTSNGWPASGNALLVSLSSGSWTKTPAGTMNVPPDQTAQPLTSWRSFESLKWLAPGDAWALRLGADEGPDALEMLPLEDPFALDEGDKLTVRLVSGQRPIADAVVAYGGQVRGRTDADGRINIRLKHAGTQLLTASWVRPDPSGRCEKIVTTTALQFELEKR